MSPAGFTMKHLVWCISVSKNLRAPETGQMSQTSVTLWGGGINSREMKLKGQVATG